MIQSDYHVHTSFSSDSDTPMEEMIKHGINLGLHHICITDHMDLDFPKQYEHDFLFDVAAQQAKIDEMNSLYGHQIHIYKGIELGLQPHLGPDLLKLTSENHFDFIIASTHVVDGMDPYYKEYWTNGKCTDFSEGIRRYYQTTLDSLKAFHDFDVFGHIDYIIRYLPKDQPFTYHSLDYMDILDEILTEIINLGKGIEVNTGGYKAGLGSPNPEASIIRRYKELGGEIITIASDAHTPEYLGYEFNKVADLFTSLGLKYYTIFNDRTPLFLKIS